MATRSLTGGRCVHQTFDRSVVKVFWVVKSLMHLALLAVDTSRRRPARRCPAQRPPTRDGRIKLALPGSPRPATARGIGPHRHPTRDSLFDNGSGVVYTLILNASTSTVTVPPCLRRAATANVHPRRAAVALVDGRFDRPTLLAARRLTSPSRPLTSAHPQALETAHWTCDDSRHRTTQGSRRLPACRVLSEGLVSPGVPIARSSRYAARRRAAVSDGRP
ncbi:hypothetical protein B0H10DRAFT_2435266 [Mycena sp. CBHHK59/15]|nr:hypothetical protein B0H10DRAFT_2435266 [Mycena sp. CBHHK59/15]